MLPKSRIWSVLVLGLGVALLAAGISAGNFLNFSPRLPLDAQQTTWTMHDESGRALVVGAEADAKPDAEPEEAPADGEPGEDALDDAPPAGPEQSPEPEAPEGEVHGNARAQAQEIPADQHPGEEPAPEAEEDPTPAPAPEDEPGEEGASSSAGNEAAKQSTPEVYEGPMTYQIHMDIGAQSDADTAQVRIGETTVRGDEKTAADVDNLYNARVWSYVMDRGTGEAVEQANLTHTIAMPEADVNVDGYWLKFPARAEKTNYSVFDPTLRQAREAVFAEEMEIDGRTVYRYRQDIESENVATLYAGMLNTTSLPTEDGGSEQGFLFHSASNDFYVDQVTGMVVGMDLDIDDYYGTKDGERRYDALQFAGKTSEEDQAAFLAQAEDIPDQQVARIARWVTIGLGALLTLLGLLGALGLFGRNKPAGGFESRGRGQGRGVARPVSRGGGDTDSRR